MRAISLLFFLGLVLSMNAADEPNTNTPTTTPFRSAQHGFDEMLNLGAYSLYVDQQFKEINDILECFLGDNGRNSIDALSAQLFYDKLNGICYVIENQIPFEKLDGNAARNAQFLLQIRLLLMDALGLKPNPDAKPSAQDIASKFPIFLKLVKSNLSNLKSK